MDSSGEKPAAQSKVTLWLILFVCVLPIVASTALYFLWTPARFVNHGELLDPVPLAEVAFSRKDGGSFSFSELDGRWSLVSIDDAVCSDYCATKLYLMRQIRLTQGKYADRIQRVWLIRDGRQPAPETMSEYVGTHAIALSDQIALELFPADGDPGDYIYLVDPVGNLMMRFPPDADPSRIKKDISKLLRVSSGWRRL